MCEAAYMRLILLIQEAISYLSCRVHLKHTPSFSSIEMHSDSEPKHWLQGSCFKLHGIYFPFMQICKEMLHFSTLCLFSPVSKICVQLRFTFFFCGCNLVCGCMSVLSFVKKKKKSVSCTLSSFKLCIYFCCCIDAVSSNAFKHNG